MTLHYQLTREEINESLLSLNWKREGTFRDSNRIVMSIIGFAVLYQWMRNPGQVFLFLLLVLIIAMLLYLTYGPSVSRHRRLKAMTGAKGHYNLQLSETGIVYGDKGEQIGWPGKGVTLLQTEKVYTMKINHYVFSIPKRILSAGQQQQLLQLLAGHKGRMINVVIEKE